MNDADALTVMSALAQATRLKVLILLASTDRRGLPSGEIADVVGVPRHLMSAHLTVLSRAGLVFARKDGRTVSYAVSADVILELSGYLRSLVDEQDR